MHTDETAKTTATIVIPTPEEQIELSNFLDRLYPLEIEVDYFSRPEGEALEVCQRLASAMQFNGLTSQPQLQGTFQNNEEFTTYAQSTSEQLEAEIVAVRAIPQDRQRQL